MESTVATICITLAIIAAFAVLAVNGLRYLWSGLTQPWREGNLPHCRRCDYLVIGLKSLRCPECGSPLDVVLGERRRFRIGKILLGAACLALVCGMLAWIILPKFTGRV